MTSPGVYLIFEIPLGLGPCCPRPSVERAARPKSMVISCMWDETEFRVQPYQSRASLTSCFNSYGSISWRSQALTAVKRDVLRTCSHMQRATCSQLCSPCSSHRSLSLVHVGKHSTMIPLSAFLTLQQTARVFIPDFAGFTKPTMGQSVRQWLRELGQNTQCL